MKATPEALALPPPPQTRFSERSKERPALYPYDVLADQAGSAPKESKVIGAARVWVTRLFLFCSFAPCVAAFGAGALLVISAHDRGLWRLGSGCTRGLGGFALAFAVECLIGLLFLLEYYHFTPRRSAPSE